MTRKTEYSGFNLTFGLFFIIAYQNISYQNLN